MFLTFIKKTARIIILLILVVITGALINSVFNAWYLDYFTFFAEKNRVLDRANALSLGTQYYDEQQSLAGLEKNLLNGDFYRLDDHIHSADMHRIDDGRSAGQCLTEIDLNFQIPDQVPLSSGHEEKIAHGILRYTNSNDSILTSIIPLEINLEELDSVNIRIKLSKSKRVYFGWTADFAANWNDKDRVHYVKFFTIPDRQFQDYTIGGAAITAAQKKISEPIRKIFLVPETRESVEISHVRFNGRMKKYIDQGCGVAYEKINNETRRSLFVESGHEVAFEVDIPADRPSFTFGVGAVNPSPVSIAVILRTDEHENILLTENFSGPAAWKDFRFDLSLYSGKHCRLLLRSEGDAPNALLISSPIVLTPFRKPFNAMLVIEDSLRADHLSCYGYDCETSPVKDMWAGEGVLFSRAFSQASFTRASCASFLTSLYPGATGVWTPFDVLDDSYITLAEILHRQGFATLLITQIVNVSEDSGLHQGFDRIIDFRTVGAKASGVYGNDILDQWISSHEDQNKFIYLHIFDPHHPYDPPEDFAAEYHGKPYIGGNRPLTHSSYFDPAWLRQPTVESRNFLYDEEIRYNDGLFVSLIETLKKHGIYQDTIVVFTSDHGEFLGEHGLWGHMPPNHRQVLHVPMIMVYPAVLPNNTNIQRPVQLLDIMPTILDLASISTDGLLLQGDSLLPLIRGDHASYWNRRFCISDEIQNSRKDDQKGYQSIIYRNFHILTTNAIDDPLRHMMRNIYPDISETVFQTRLYNMDNDPDEYRTYLNFFADIYFQYKIRRFAGQLRQANLKLRHNITRNTATSSTIDTGVLEQLKSLGYVH